MHEKKRDARHFSEHKTLNLCSIFFRLLEMFSQNFDSDCDGEQNRPFTTRKQRVMKGVNSQTVHQEENSALMKEAKSKRWVSHMPGDEMSFNFEFNYFRWPKDMDIATKLSLQPGDTVLLKFSEKAEYAY